MFYSPAELICSLTILTLYLSTSFRIVSFHRFVSFVVVVVVVVALHCLSYFLVILTTSIFVLAFIVVDVDVVDVAAAESLFEPIR